MERKTFLVAIFGVMVQYYDHHLFGFLAAKISKYFIPSEDAIVQLLNTYFIMAIAVFAKPVGALMLGRIGDLYGRSTTLNISLLGTSIASFAVCMTPGYSEIGIISIIILLLSRMCTSALASSGTDGVRLFVYEHIGKARQCLGNGLVIASTMLGSFIASMSAWFFTLDMMPDYFWRFSFFIGFLMGICMIFIRLYFDVNDHSVNIKEPDYDVFKDVPMWQLLVQYKKLFIVCSLVAGAIGSTNQFYIIFFGTYNFTILKFVAYSDMQFYTSVAIVIYIIFGVIGGLLGDYIGRKIVHFIAFTILMTITIATIYDIAHGSMNYYLFFASNAILPVVNVTALAFLKQSIPKVIRYRIFSLAHAVGSICISTPTAFISVLMYHETKLAWIPMLYFMCVITIISSGVFFLCARYRANEY